MTRSGTWGIGITCVVIAALGGARWIAARKSAPIFRDVQVTRGDLRVTVLATGAVQPQNRLELKPPIAGRVEEILVEEGQVVQKGAVLARMSSTERAALLDAAHAKGPEEVAHWEELYKPAPLIAPIDATVIAKNVEPGQSVTAQDAVLVLSDRLIVKTQVDETDIGRITVDQPARLTLDAYPEQVIDGRVDHIAYEAKTVNNVTIYEVDVLPDTVPDVMRSGMTADVTFLIDAKHDTAILPVEAVHQEHGRKTVLVPGRTRGSPTSREIVTGVSDGKQVEVLSGLDVGDTVLVTTVRTPRRTGRLKAAPSLPWVAGSGRWDGRNHRMFCRKAVVSRKA